MHGVRTIGFDIDSEKIEKLKSFSSYIDAVKDSDLVEIASNGKLTATTDFTHLRECDVIVICVPTPLTQNRDPDISFIQKSCEVIARHITRETIVSLESTSYPGTVKEVVAPILESSGLKIDEDIFVAFSPEREDPGNAKFSTYTIPKIVGADTANARALAVEFYDSIVAKVIPVSSTMTAEAVKLTENVFRSVNIALVNELKIIYTRMGIDIWEVIEAASTKPFGFMPFYPGPGLGGHCIPIDPFYLSWKARQYEISTKFIELAGEINLGMTDYVVARLREGLDREYGRGLKGTRILVVGVAYKKNVGDVRESPAVKIISVLLSGGAKVEYHDPHVSQLPKMRAYPAMHGKQSVAAGSSAMRECDAIVIVTDHDDIDYRNLIAMDKLIVDTRNAIEGRGLTCRKLIKA